MRIHTPKLKAPHPLAVLAVCLLWPAAATIGALISNANAEQIEQTQSIAAQPSPPVAHHSVAHHDARLVVKKTVDTRS